jgi:hypothetical protein
MDIAANSPGSQNIVHDKKQQGAARGGYAVLRFTCADHDDRLCCSLKSQRRQRGEIAKRALRKRARVLSRENPAWQAWWQTRRTIFAQLCLTEHVQLIAIVARPPACIFFSI